MMSWAVLRNIVFDKDGKSLEYRREGGFIGSYLMMAALAGATR